MSARLFFQALGKFFLGLVVVGVLLFVPAGTLNYWQGWLFVGVLFVPMFVAGVVLMFRQPELLRKRLEAKEEEKEQKWVVALSGMLLYGETNVATLKRAVKQSSFVH